MNYLQNRKIKRKKIEKIVLVVIILLFLIYFGSNIFSGLSFVSHAVFKPVLVLGNSIGEKFGNIGAYFKSKKNLYLENESLRERLNENTATLSNYNSLLGENVGMKEILGMGGEERDLVLASILSKPPKSLYDTLVIDAGEKNGVLVGDLVFAEGDVPLGRIESVNSGSSKVILFSSPKYLNIAILDFLFFPKNSQELLISNLFVAYLVFFVLQEILWRRML